MFEHRLPRALASLLKGILYCAIAVYLAVFTYYFTQGPFDFTALGVRVNMPDPYRPAWILFWTMLITALVSRKFYGLVAALHGKARQWLVDDDMQAPAPAPWLDYLAVPAVYFVMAVVMTWPVASGLGVYLDNSGDPVLNSWILWRINESLWHSPFHLLDGNIFYPYADVMTWSETMISGALLVLPVHLLSGAPVVEYNTLLLLAFTLNAVGTYFLAKKITGSRGGAFFAGIVFAFAMPRYNHIQHIQMMCSHWIPFCLLYWIKFLERPRFGSSALFMIFAVLVILSNMHFAVYTVLAMVVWGIVEIMFGKDRLKSIWYLAGPCIIAVAALAPLLLHYVGNTPRRLADTYAYSNAPESFINPYSHGWLYGAWWSSSLPGGPWFAGISPLLFTAVALVCLASGGVKRRKTVFTITIIGALGAWASLGAQYWLYEFLFDNFPGFNGIRATERIAILYLLALAVLSAQGLSAILNNRRPVWGRAIVAVACVALLAESVSVHDGWFGFPENDYKKFAWLKKRADVKNIFYVPAQRIGARAVMSSAYHGKNMINGYSGYFPQLYVFLRENQYNLPSRELVRILQAVKVDHLLLDRCCVEGSRIKEIQDFDELTPDGERNALALVKVAPREIRFDREKLLSGDVSEFFEYDDVSAKLSVAGQATIADDIVRVPVKINNVGAGGFPPGAVSLDCSINAGDGEVYSWHVPAPPLPGGKEELMNAVFLIPAGGDEMVFNVALTMRGKILDSIKPVIQANPSSRLSVASVTASVYDDHAHEMADGKLDTRWTTAGEPAIGQWVTLELEKPGKVHEVILVNPPASAGDHPTALDVYLADDNRQWRLAGRFEDMKPEIIGGVKTLKIPLEGSEARYIKLVARRLNALRWWSVCEVLVK